MVRDITEPDQDTQLSTVELDDMGTLKRERPERSGPVRPSPERPRPGQQQDTIDEDSRAQWRSLIDDLTKVSEQKQVVSEIREELSRDQPITAPRKPPRRGQRAADRRQLPRFEEGDASDTLISFDTPDDDREGAEHASVTVPDIQLTARMQSRFADELQSELADVHPAPALEDLGPPAEEDEIDGDPWSYPPTIQIDDDEEELQELEQGTSNVVTIISRPPEDRRPTALEVEAAEALTVAEGGSRSSSSDPADETVAPDAAPTAALPTAKRTATAPRPVVLPPPDGVPFGNYWLRRKIKTGGMAEVYEATTQPVGGEPHTVAIKRIHLPLTESEDFVAMFIDEAKITVQLDHAAIVQVYELGQVGAQYYIAMEYVHGRDLDLILRRTAEMGSKLPVAIAVYIVQQALAGLDYAHRRCDQRGKSLGIVHRDVSPPNILCGFEGQVKLTDFGVAKAASKVSVTRPGLVLGKLGYMSPEQVRADKLDRRSDIFAAGVILWEALAGKRLFRGRSDVETIRNVLKADVPPIRSIRSDVSGDVAALIHQALERDPAKRPLWASEMSDKLAQWLQRNGFTKMANDLLVFMAAMFEGTPAGEPIFKRDR